MGVGVGVGWAWPFSRKSSSASVDSGGFRGLLVPLLPQTPWELTSWASCRRWGASGHVAISGLTSAAKPQRASSCHLPLESGDIPMGWNRVQEQRRLPGPHPPAPEPGLRYTRRSLPGTGAEECPGQVAAQSLPPCPAPRRGPGAVSTLQLLLQPSPPVCHLRPHHVATCGLGAPTGGGSPASLRSQPLRAVTPVLPSTATSSQPRSLHLGDRQPGSQGHSGGSGPPGLDAALATCCWARPQVKRAHPTVIRAVAQDPGWALCGSLSPTVTTAAGGILGCSSLTYQPCSGVG